MSKRGGRVPAPPKTGHWDLRFADKKASDAWEGLCNSVPSNCRAMHEALSIDPRDAVNPNRHHRLKGELGSARHSGRVLEQWQYELTGGGRVWFLVDDEQRRVWLTLVAAGHPKATD